MHSTRGVYAGSVRHAKFHWPQWLMTLLKVCWRCPVHRDSLWVHHFIMPAHRAVSRLLYFRIDWQMRTWNIIIFHLVIE